MENTELYNWKNNCRLIIQFISFQFVNLNVRDILWLRIGFQFFRKKFPFWKWNDSEICCANQNFGITERSVIPDILEKNRSGK